MDDAESTPRRRRPLRAAARARAVATTAVVGLCAVGLSACRTIGPGAEAQREGGAVVAAKATPVPATPVVTATPTATSATPSISPGETTPRATSNAAPTSADVPSSTPSGATTAGSIDPTTPAAGDPATTPLPPQPPKLVVDNPWLVVGRAFIVDTTAPRATTTGLTGFRLIFRTRGDFRGVRAGTPFDDPRHYKIGQIQLPELPAYLPGGGASLQLGDRNKSKGRYCWSVALGKQGTSGKIVFPARANGTAVAVEFDLHGAPVQRRTASVFVRTRPGEQPSAVQNRLGCHLNYF